MTTTLAPARPTPAPSTVRAAGLYLRISQDRGGEGLGVQRQRDLCASLAEGKGWPVADVYCDNDLSAYSGKVRPEYERMLADIGAGRVDAVVCVDLDRLTRQPAELERFIVIADQHQVALANVSGDTDLSTSDGRFRARILGAVARQESEKKSERLRRQREQAAGLGLPQGGRRPYGWDRSGPGMELVPHEVAVIRECVDRVLAGDSVRSVAVDLNRRAVRSSAGGEWTVTSLRSMLVGPRLAGLRVHRGEVVGEGQWQPVVTPEEHEALKAVVGDPRSRKAGRPPTALLTGVLRCGRCGALMYSARRPDGARKYTCQAGPGRDSCGRLSVAAGPCEEEVVGQVLATLASPTLAEAVEDADPTDLDRAALVKGIRDDSARLEALEIAHYAEGELSRAGYLAAKERLAARVEASRRALAERERSTVLSGLPTDPGELREMWDAGELEWRRRVLAEMVERVTLKPYLGGPRSRFDVNRVRIGWRA